jgi:hypothetical protein
MKLKMLIAAITAIISTSAFASGDMKAIMENIRMQQEIVNADLLRVNLYQLRVKQAGKQCRETKTASAHKEYMNASADLRNARKQLKIDDRNLMEAHQAHIRAHKTEVREEVKVLERAQHRLDREKARGNVAALGAAESVMNARAETRNRFTALERARLERDKDRWVINREFYDMDAKSSLKLSSGTAILTESRAEK